MMSLSPNSYVLHAPGVKNRTINGEVVSVSFITRAPSLVTEGAWRGACYTKTNIVEALAGGRSTGCLLCVLVGP